MVDTSGKMVTNPLYSGMRAISPGIDKMGVAKDLAGIGLSSVPIGGLLGKGAGLFSKLVGRGATVAEKGAAVGTAARTTTVASKIEGQLAKRGWSRSSVDDAISNPTRTVRTADARHLPGGGRNAEPATAYYSRDGGYVVRNDRTGDIVQISNRNDPNWRAPWE